MNIAEFISTVCEEAADGVGVRSKIALCMSCGHDRVAHEIAYVKKKNGLDATQLFIACVVRDHATQLEFHRLAAIDV